MHSDWYREVWGKSVCNRYIFAFVFIDLRQMTYGQKYLKSYLLNSSAWLGLKAMWQEMKGGKRDI